MKEIIIDGVVYVEKENNDHMKFVIIRTYTAGVHCGYLKSKNYKNVVLIDSRRIWRWDGAFTLNELATFGPKIINGCKFSCNVAEIEVTECIEIINVSDVAKQIILSVPDYHV